MPCSSGWPCCPSSPTSSVSWRYDWGFNELSALFLVGSFAIGLAAGLGLSGTAIQWLKGMESMLAAALLIGVARAMSVVLTDGRVMDTIVYGLATPLVHVPGVLAGLLMVPIHALLHVPVVSVSGQAVLTMPIMAPLADLLGVSRDAAVLAYQTGAGLMDMITPTNGALLAMLFRAQATVWPVAPVRDSRRVAGGGRRTDRDRDGEMRTMRGRSSRGMVRTTWRCGRTSARGKGHRVTRPTSGSTGPASRAPSRATGWSSRASGPSGSRRGRRGASTGCPCAAGR